MNVKYEKAPIVEALIEIQVELGSIRAIPEIEEILKPKVSADYPLRGVIDNFRGDAKKVATGEADFERSRVGIVFRSQDGKQNFQAHLDRFIFARLAPYGTWSELTEEAGRLWEIYKTAVHVSRVNGVAVRYINRIDFNQLSVQFSDYLTTYPEISSKVPDSVSNFFVRLEIPQPDGSTVVLIESSLPTKDDGNVSMIVDISVAKGQEPPDAIENPWALLESLRTRKNLYFENLITEKTRQLFGERTEY